ncbi:alpha/beta fold hydrolase [Rubrobacter taiwanensis]|uniref:alpha/beta fold hydrolase n=1 Tax=Rubrobacter taiwanensis TaxID=185139 RepID=UPI0014045435|nr:alpha/beta hydrolase [Rubrobacter taiwanensis]
MSGAIFIILLIIAVFLAAAFALTRRTYEVQNLSDGEYLELDGAWIRYRVSGGGPPVLLVHGWMTSSELWEPVARALERQHTVYRLDLRGFGDSDKPASGYGIRNGSRLLYAFAAHFGLTGVTVVGHDLGGAMAVKLAADHREIVGRLVLVATPASEEQMDLPNLLWLSTLPVVGPVFYSVARLVPQIREWWLRPFVSDPSALTGELIEATGRPTPAAVLRTYRTARRELTRGRLTRQARLLDIPALILAGEEDAVVDPAATVDWARTLKNSEVVLMPGCGHLPMLERPEEFVEHLASALGGSGEGDTAEYPVENAPAPEGEPRRPGGYSFVDDDLFQNLSDPRRRRSPEPEAPEAAGEEPEPPREEPRREREPEEGEARAGEPDSDRKPGEEMERSEFMRQLSERLRSARDRRRRDSGASER